MAGYDDYQTEEEYIAASKRRRESETDTKELVARLRRGCNCRLCKMDRCCCAEMEDAADTIEHLERERDEWREAAAFHEHNWQQERDLKIGIAAELDTLRARLAKMEETLKFIKRTADNRSENSWFRLIADEAASALTEEQP